MKKLFIIFFMLILCFLNSSIVQAESNQTPNEVILNSQEKELGISDFIKSSKEYTKDNLDGIDISGIFKSAITGRIGNVNLFNNILNIFGREFKSTISSIRYSIYNYYNTQYFNKYKRLIRK